MYTINKGILIILACFIEFTMCQQFKQQNFGYFNRMNNAIKLTENAHKRSPNGVTDFRRLFGITTTDDVVNRAEELLSSGILDNPLFEVSSLCLNHTKLLIKALTQRETWAVKMIDSTGKPGSDILEGNFRFVGNWEECRGVHAVENDTNMITNPYTGKYCTGYIPIDAAQRVYAQIGICFPDSCNDADASALLNTLLSTFSLIGGCQCKENSLEYTDKAVVVFVVCGIFGAIIFLATAYDVVVQHYLSKKPTGYKPILENGQHYGSVSQKVNDSILTTSADIKETRFDQRTKTQNQEPVYTYYTPSILGKLLLSFSVYTNAAKILNTNQPAATLTSVNGIRFISMTWVILGHTYYFGLGQVENTATLLPNLFSRFTFQAISNATVAVDTFFVLSGLLVSYLSLREMERRGSALKFNWIMFYFHRFWRLTPPYMLFLMVYVPTFKYWGDGPFWPQQGVETKECENTWWTNILYVNNFVKTEQMCMGWSWYLANDMQFYILSPMLLIPLYYGNQDGNFSDIYIKPYTRVAPYVVGFYTGYLLYKTKNNVKIPKVVNILGWAVATTFAMLSLYGVYSSDTGTKHLNEDVSAFYYATFRTAWGLAIAWVIFACATGYGGPVNSLLSWKGIIPLSRLTYCAYLVHPIAMYLYYQSRRSLMHWYDLEIIYLFFGNLCVSYAAAFVVSLAFESPMMGLEKVLLKRSKNS
ncbi:nose resistant to fluoxetine protein 6-like isoform X2 [Ruditapes philippinarum]|uniref:nose resistant to fluoxetine protein 6-like isoform X2 n=1 Tax=Ruditapes philippinarum TaxID=129788 RepID=UPI00295AFCED|nr:nose resistant to fluoxetine protein 6-like isoform X2 [Ruditapes philippinarum]